MSVTQFVLMTMACPAVNVLTGNDTNYHAHQFCAIFHQHEDYSWETQHASYKTAHSSVSTRLLSEFVTAQSTEQQSWMITSMTVHVCMKSPTVVAIRNPSNRSQLLAENTAY